MAALIWWVGRRDARPASADAVVVLGARHHGTRPSRVFAARLDHAVELVLQGAAPYLVVTGGSAPSGDITEAEVARRYAAERGVPASAILAETSGRNTLDSLRNVAALLHERRLRRAIFVSDRTHMLRVLLIARRLGISGLGSPTQSSPADLHPAARLRATLHEIGALLRWITGPRR